MEMYTGVQFSIQGAAFALKLLLEKNREGQREVLGLFRSGESL